MIRAATLLAAGLPDPVAVAVPLCDALRDPVFRGLK
jgi:hypothetical protein